MTRAIAGLLPAADDSAHGEVAELLSQHIDTEATIPDSDINRVFDCLDHDKVDPATRESLWGLALTGPRKGRESPFTVKTLSC